MDELMKSLQGKSAEQIAEVVRAYMAQETERIIRDRSAKDREQRIEEGRRAVRKKIFRERKLNRQQQISVLYELADAHANEMHAWLQNRDTKQ